MNPWSIDRTGHGSNPRWLLPVLTLIILLGALVVLARFHPSLNAAATAANNRTEPENPLWVLTGTTMGTGYRVLVPGHAVPTGVREELSLTISDRLQYLDRGLFSTYTPDSQLSRLNNSPVGRPISVSAEMLLVLESAVQVHSASRGAFDVTIKPLVDLWGFGAAGASDTLPDATAINEALAQMGMDKLRVDAGNSTVTRTGPISIDLSAIAKGYAVDAVAGLLIARGITDYLVEIGGEVRLSGQRPDGRAWQLGIETPQEGVATLYRAINVGTAPLAVAGSGNYRNYFRYAGTRYAHTIDPVTGSPVSHNLASVTVIADSAMQADAWATALAVLGPEAGMKLANELQLAAYFIVDEDGGFTARHSSAFTPYL